MAGIDYLPKEDAVSDALTSSIGTVPGMYMFPTGGLTKQSSSEEEEKGMERMMEEMKTKPSGLLVYKPARAAPSTSVNASRIARSDCSQRVCPPVRYKDKGRHQRKARMSGPLSDCEVLFWHWIGSEVGVNHHPLVALFHKDAG